MVRKKHQMENLKMFSDTFDSFEEEIKLERDDDRSKQDFQRLYAKLESWRVQAEKQISTNRSG